MSAPADLTRWNRAGLARFRYVDGNAATYLEALREALAARFPGWEDLEVDVPAGEGDADRLERLLDQYFEREPRGTAGGRSREAVARLRRDPAWQITRAAARAVHVAGEYLDAYANEGFLRTATQWDNVRRLVEMLDVQPAPPASASTVLVLTAKGEPGTVEAGFQVQHTPPEGGPPIVFETLQDVEVDPALNEVRLADWNRSPARLGASTDAPWIAGEESEISAGQLAILVTERTARRLGRVRDEAARAAAVVPIKEVDASRRIALEIVAGQPDWSEWTKGETRLLARPEFIERPRLNGPGVVPFAEAHDLTAGEVVAWQVEGGWAFATVRETDERAARLEGAEPPADGVAIFRALRLERSADGLLLPLAFQAAARPTDGGFEVLTAADSEVIGDNPRLNGLRRVKAAVAAEVRVVPGTASEVGRAAAAQEAGVFLFNGKPGKLAAGQWVVADDGQDRLRALLIARIRELEDHYELTLDARGDANAPADRERVPAPGRLARLYALFAETLRPEGHDHNDTKIIGSRLLLDLASLGGRRPPLLARGRELVLERQGSEDFAGARKVRVERVVAASGALVSPAIEKSEGFTLGNAVLRGNLAAAGHGEGKPEKVLGSGDATLGNQIFVLAQKGVSFVADPTQPSGVRADVAVRVEGQTWEQVAALRESGPTDPHYTVRVTEEGQLAVGFGDGRAGRRLPTGTNNVRIRFRVGSGLAGNLPPGSFAKPKRPHRRVAGVRQPFAATGGNDQEPIDSLRENAPASVLTLERAVSLADFTHLAARQASVWQARAFSLPTADRRQGSIEVVVVPAGGGTLGDLAVTLRDFLRAHALPGVDVAVSLYESRPFDLTVNVQVLKGRFDREEVRERVRAALLAAFSLRRRRLGQDLFLSEVVQVVEGVQGVENSVSVLAGDPAVRRLPASDRQVFHLDPALSRLDVEAREFEL